MKDALINYRRSGQVNRFVLLISVFTTFVMGGSVAPVMAEQMSPAYNITDGRPWKMTMDDGRVTTLVLFENGKGKMSGGPVELSPKWRATPDGLCLKPGTLLPERCVQLVRSNNGYIGMRAGEQLFKLER
ncbi:hypothetical protein [Phenylobacterium sp.]|uniref:hypothetical protein n=1 Tax=Phenylobacterium sp. TaxID=1871053 RepID=UPI0035B39460